MKPTTTKEEKLAEDINNYWLMSDKDMEKGNIAEAELLWTFT